MSHPDPLYDPENSEDDDMNYDDHDDFYDNDLDNSGEIYWDEDDGWHDEDTYDDSMDGDHESGLASAGWGTDEDYGSYSDPDDYGSYGEDY